MGEVVRLAAPAAVPIQRGCNVNDNRRSGFRLMYCSMKDAPWYKDLAKKSVMLHLIADVVHENSVVTFGRHRLSIKRGQQVYSAKSLGEACGVSDDQARRALEYFEEEGAISRSARQGKGGYTIVTLLNFDAYQRGVSQQFSAELAAEFEAAPDKGLEGNPLLRAAELGAELQAEDLISNNINTDLKDPLSKISGEIFDEDGEHSSQERPDAEDPEPKTRTIAGAAIQTPGGKAWGTAEDLRIAQWMFKRVQVLTPTALEPNWAQWANVIRLMREIDRRSHRDICELYDWVSRDSFWCTNVLAPQKLRQKWDQLQARRLNGPRPAAGGDHTDLTKSMTADELNRRMQEGF